MTTPAPAKVTIVQHFKAPPERVYDAWLDPKLISQWMFGPALREEEVLHISVDAQQGGAFSFLVRRQGVEIDHVGTYSRLERPNRLAFTWGIRGESVDESTVTVTILAQNSGLGLTLVHELQSSWAHYADKVTDGWSKMLKVLAETLV